MRTIEQRKYNYSQGEILLLSWVTGGMKKWQKCVAQEEIWFAAQTNPIKLFPKFEEVSCGAGIEIPIEMKYEKQSKQIQSNVSPNLRLTVRHPPALRRFPDTLWRKKTPGSTSKSEFRCMGGLINQETPLSSTFDGVEACWKFRIRVGGVAAAVSLFGDDLNCICFDHPNRETAMLSRWLGSRCTGMSRLSLESLRWIHIRCLILIKFWILVA